jgi:hypothetical protein
MTADDPYDNDAAGDKAPGHDRFSDNATRASGRPEDDIDAGSSAEALDRGKCFDDLRAHDRECGPASGSPDKAQLTEDGKWKWKGLELSAEQNRIADEEIAARQKAEGRDAEGNYGEGGLTPAMRRIEAELEHGSLVPDTEKFALKSPDRFKEKLAKMISLEPDIPPSVHAANIHDGIRFTFLFEGDFYSDGVREAESRIADEGHNFVGRKPNWSGEEYKGINSQWRDASSNQLFEVQFHTPESWDAKQQTHDAYEKIECPTTAQEERARLRAYQREVAASVPVPSGALDFTPYKAEDDEDCRRM